MPQYAAIHTYTSYYQVEKFLVTWFVTDFPYRKLNVPAKQSSWSCRKYGCINAMFTFSVPQSALMIRGAPKAVVKHNNFLNTSCV